MRRFDECDLSARLEIGLCHPSTMRSSATREKSHPYNADCKTNSTLTAKLVRRRTATASEIAARPPGSVVPTITTTPPAWTPNWLAFHTRALGFHTAHWN